MFIIKHDIAIQKLGFDHMTVAQRCICDADAQHKMLSLRKSLEVAKTRFDYQRIIWLALICQGVDTPAQLTNDPGREGAFGMSICSLEHC